EDPTISVEHGQGELFLIERCIFQQPVLDERRLSFGPAYSETYLKEGLRSFARLSRDVIETERHEVFALTSCPHHTAQLQTIENGLVVRLGPGNTLDVETNWLDIRPSPPPLRLGRAAIGYLDG